MTGRAPMAALLLAFAAGAHASEGTIELDPFAQATSGLASCPAAQPRRYTTEQAGAQAHARAERGTRCAMEGTCEPGGAYRRDPEINDAVRKAIAGDARFAGTSVWITTSRRWVTIEGCVRSKAQRTALVEFVRTQPRVERVFDELSVRSR
ncbi:MAG: BON domain-containing protein [Burkholderiales bacterium]